MMCRCCKREYAVKGHFCIKCFFDNKLGQGIKK